MNLFIMRHGQAQLHAASDNLRQLTERGFSEAELMAGWFNRQAIEISHVIVSPYVRAQQTAATFIESYKNVVIQETSSLYVPHANAKNAHDYLDGFLSITSTQGVLIVSHMPLVSYLVESITGGSSAPIFQTCGVAQIEYNEDTMLGGLVGMVAPNTIV